MQPCPNPSLGAAAGRGVAGGSRAAAPQRSSSPGSAGVPEKRGAGASDSGQAARKWRRLPIHPLPCPPPPRAAPPPTAVSIPSLCLCRRRAGPCRPLFCFGEILKGVGQEPTSCLAASLMNARHVSAVQGPAAAGTASSSPTLFPRAQLPIAQPNPRHQVLPKHSLSLANSVSLAGAFRWAGGRGFPSGRSADAASPCAHVAMPTSRSTQPSLCIPTCLLVCRHWDDRAAPGVFRRLRPSPAPPTGPIPSQYVCAMAGGRASGLARLLCRCGGPSLPGGSARELARCQGEKHARCLLAWRPAECPPGLTAATAAPSPLLCAVQRGALCRMVVTSSSRCLALPSRPRWTHSSSSQRSGAAPCCSIRRSCLTAWARLLPSSHTRRRSNHSRSPRWCSRQRPPLGPPRRQRWQHPR